MPELLNRDQIEAALKEAPDWKLTGGDESIYCVFEMKNFMAAVDFIGKVAEVAEAMDHHPDIHLTEYRRLVLELSTHSLGGISDLDFKLAAKIKELPGDFKDDPYQE